MSKFLKHLGIGTGGKKSNGAVDFQAKTLPPPPAGKGYGRRETIETCRESSSISTGSRVSSSSPTTDASAASRRASHDSYRTMPTRGLRMRPERDKEKEWTLRGSRSRETSSSLRSHNSGTQNESEQLSSTTGDRRKIDDSTDLRRSITTDDIGSTTALSTNGVKNQLPPALGEYSDPFDLRVQLPESPEVVIDAAVALPLADDDYSVPYELKDRLKDVPAADSIVEDQHEHETEDDGLCKYDDPYEENPIALMRQQNIESAALQQVPVVTEPSNGEQRNRLSPEPVCFDSAPFVSNSSTQVTFSSADVGDLCARSQPFNSQTPPPEEAPKPMRSYELSAEYGGFFVPSTPVVTNAGGVVLDDADKDDDGAYLDYTDLQAPLPQTPVSNSFPTSGGSLIGSSAPVGLRHGVGIGLGGGFYEEPWDLSTTRRGLTEKWKHTKQTKDVGIMAVLDSVVQPTELYAQPHKNSDRSHRSKLMDSAEMRSTGPSYGILCQRVADNGMMAPVSMRDVGVGGGRSVGQARVDLRPVEDYDVPWDQKKVFCKTANDAGYLSAKLQGSVPPTQLKSFSLLADRDLKMPLDKQMWYHGSISRRDAENMLRGQQEGSYLIRTSESNKLDYSLSVKSVSGFMHMKIVANQDGRYILGQFSQPFFTIAQMVHYYTMNKLPIKGAEHISLSFPVKQELL